MNSLKDCLITTSLLWSFLLAGPCIAENSQAERFEQPNIVLILVDDLAWSDLACYGHPWHETPHIDGLSAEGIQFQQAYASAPICSASRASILTGKTPARLGFEFVTKDASGQQQIQPEPQLRAPPYTLDLTLQEKSIAEYLDQYGYRTAFFGKWHVAKHHNRYLGWSPTHGPIQQGFEIAVEDFGSHPYSKRSPRAIERSGRFPEDSMTQRAVEFIRANGSSPFFLMVSHFYVHTPVKTNCTWLREKYDAKIPQRSPNRSLRVEYACFVETMDHYVGELLQALEKEELKQSTIVVFTSDNGGHPEYTSNSSLRGSKWNLYEGGIRVPLVVRWPGQIASNSTSETPTIGYDLLPTFLDLSQADAPSWPTDLDGQSLVPMLKGAAHWRNRPLYWHFPYYHPEGDAFGQAKTEIGIDDFAISQTRPQSAIRIGDYKLIQFYENESTELYNLRDDPSEMRDLSQQDPMLASELQRSLQDYLHEVDARMPQPNH